MNFDVVKLTADLVNLPSVSRGSNEAISDYLEAQLKDAAFAVERLSYIDENGENKVSLVAKKGKGKDGLAFFSHSDTVPGQEADWEAFQADITQERIIGRGSCDMKGPLAATMVAAAQVDLAQLKRPVYVVVCADEEVGGFGAQQVVAESDLFKTARPKYGVVAEPTTLIPVYAHKGGKMVEVTAYGKAAHTSTDKGISANFLIVPFLSDMLALAEQVKQDQSFMNPEFDPPTCGFNMILNDGNCVPNVTAAKTICTVGFRVMPNARADDLLDRITSRATHYSFDYSISSLKTFYISPEAEIVQVACQATAISPAQTVSYGTDASFLDEDIDLVVLGPGDIAQAHTVGEWIAIEQLTKAVDVYGQMIERLCM